MDYERRMMPSDPNAQEVHDLTVLLAQRINPHCHFDLARMLIDTPEWRADTQVVYNRLFDLLEGGSVFKEYLGGL